VPWGAVVRIWHLPGCGSVVGQAIVYSLMAKPGTLSCNLLLAGKLKFGVTAVCYSTRLLTPLYTVRQLTHNDITVGRFEGSATIQ
jgi:hypothetical protein